MQSSSLAPLRASSHAVASSSQGSLPPRTGTASPQMQRVIAIAQDYRKIMDSHVSIITKKVESGNIHTHQGIIKLTVGKSRPFYLSKKHWNAAAIKLNSGNKNLTLSAEEKRSIKQVESLFKRSEKYKAVMKSLDSKNELLAVLTVQHHRSQKK